MHLSQRLASVGIKAAFFARALCLCAVALSKLYTCFRIGGHTVQKPLSNSTYIQEWSIAAGAARSAIGCGAAGYWLEAGPKAPMPSQQKLGAPLRVAPWVKLPGSAGMRPPLGATAPAPTAPRDTVPSQAACRGSQPPTQAEMMYQVRFASPGGRSKAVGTRSAT